MTRQEIGNTIYGMTMKASGDWFKRQCDDLWTAFYLYHKPGKGAKYGALRVIGDGEKVPAGFVLSDPRRISGAWSREQCRGWMREVANTLPLLPTE